MKHSFEVNTRLTHFVSVCWLGSLFFRFIHICKAGNLFITLFTTIQPSVGNNERVNHLSFVSSLSSVSHSHFWVD